MGMTRAEVIAELIRHRNEVQNDFGWNITLLKALDAAIEALKAEPLDDVLDKIRAEIEDYESDCNYHLSEEDNCRTCNKITFGSIYRIIDKYKEESK